VLGDMLELGGAAACSHIGLAPDLDAAAVDVVFACGPEMKALFDVLPSRMQGGYGPDSAALACRLSGVPGPGDVILVKGSLGMRMSAVVAALQGLEQPLSPAAAGN
jgi:UDP-N-acetylmuramoyl-tripeptide--D-alanyl-D-alanine ligase